MKDFGAIAHSAITQSGITEDRHRVGMCPTEHRSAPQAHLTGRLAEAIGLVLITGTGETDVHNLSRNDRLWYASLCVQSGALLGQAASYADFISKFSKLLESIAIDRASTDSNPMAA